MGFDNDHLGTLTPFGAPSTPSFLCSPAMPQVDPKADTGGNSGAPLLVKFALSQV
jgi:hypothetical protein